MNPTIDSLTREGWYKLQIHEKWHMVPPVHSEKCKAFVHRVYMLNEGGGLTAMAHRLDGGDSPSSCTLPHPDGAPNCCKKTPSSSICAWTNWKCDTYSLGPSCSPGPGPPGPVPPGPPGPVPPGPPAPAPTPGVYKCPTEYPSCCTSSAGVCVNKSERVCEACTENNASCFECGAPPDMTLPKNTAVGYRPLSLYKILHNSSGNPLWDDTANSMKTTPTDNVKNVVYAMIDSSGKLKSLKKLITKLKENGGSPWDRIVLGFCRPDIVYDLKSNWTQKTPGNKAQVYPENFNDLKALITSITALKGANIAKVQVFLSMGGWNYNCVPLFYLNSFSSSTDDTELKQMRANPPYGSKCEPMGAMGSTKDKNAYTFFPDPAADDIISQQFTVPDTSNSNYDSPQVLTSDLFKGSSIKLVPNPNKLEKLVYPEWGGKDKSKSATTVHQSRIPEDAQVGSKDFTSAIMVYKNFVEMANKAGASGVDLDYEEMWHADTFHDDVSGGSGSLSRTKGKLLRIIVALKYYCNYNKIGLSIPSPAVGMETGPWWFGNLKGLFLDDKYFGWTQYFKALTGSKENFDFNTIFNGGIFAMIYDVGASKNAVECMAKGAGPQACSLVEQVKWYSETYHKPSSSFTSKSVKTYLPFEIGRPAYPAWNNDKSVDGKYNLSVPLKKTDVTTILDYSDENPNYLGAFYWDIFKGAGTYTANDKCCATNDGTATSCSGFGDATGDYVTSEMLKKWNNNKITYTVNDDGLGAAGNICQYNKCSCNFSSCKSSNTTRGCED